MPEIPSNIEYKASYIKPGTPYPDEPSETIPAGWWVTGWSDTNDECADVLIYVDFAVDNDGNMIDQQMAERVAEALNAASRHNPGDQS